MCRVCGQRIGECAACFRIAPILLPIAILLLPFCLFFSELTCANIIIDKWDMSYKLTFHLFLFCKRIRTKYKASAHCRNGDEYGAFFDAENRVMTWKMKQEEIACHMNMDTIAHLKLTSRISENITKGAGRRMGKVSYQIRRSEKSIWTNWNRLKRWFW